MEKLKIQLNRAVIKRDNRQICSHMNTHVLHLLHIAKHISYIKHSGWWNGFQISNFKISSFAVRKFFVSCEIWTLKSFYQPESLSLSIFKVPVLKHFCEILPVLTKYFRTTYLKVCVSKDVDFLSFLSISKGRYLVLVSLLTNFFVLLTCTFVICMKVPILKEAFKILRVILVYLVPLSILIHFCCTKLY